MKTTTDFSAFAATLRLSDELSTEQIAQQFGLDVSTFEHRFTAWAQKGQKCPTVSTSLVERPFETWDEGEKVLQINYDFAPTPFGEVLVASTNKGLCYMGFSSDRQQAIRELHARFPVVRYIPQQDEIQQLALTVFNADVPTFTSVPLHLKGSAFQLRVWQALCAIPMGGLTTYGQIAQQIGQPNASRAVGHAVGCNPVSVLIPCHRVIRMSGRLGGYHWGLTRKIALIGWEAKQNA